MSIVMHYVYRPMQKTIFFVIALCEIFLLLLICYQNVHFERGNGPGSLLMERDVMARFSRKIFTVAAVSGLLLLSSQAASASILKAESGSPTNINTTIMTLLSKYAKEEAGISIQLNSGQTLTRTPLKVGMGQTDLTVVPSEVLSYMQNGENMYKNTAGPAQKSAENVRALFGFMAGLYHGITWADNGIENWSDFKGKRVYTGPASGTAGVNIEEFIRINSGYEPNVDYQSVKMDWPASGQAFTDGLVDILFRAALPGSTGIEEFALTRPIRLFGLTQEAAESQAWQKAQNLPGMFAHTIGADTYSNLANEDDITMIAFTMMVIANKALAEETAYQLTKSFWERQADTQASSVTLRSVSIENAFEGVVTKLHPGAYRYYQEKRINVPTELIPDEE
ncbi:TAXI family TRAP transporter solute-binding subunit [Zobellella endophytica]|uniref:TAXI family TRAP transporter solute-binding subunit n=1 Tax=Zobellella endophytica TaxID=2116700 RepID=UPI001304D118|nr:TAXI family TRAP transporter solute-binding subunit [Zobellella endophytica]